MKCVICKNGDTNEGTATITLEHRGAILVVKSVPARVCEVCGEEYIDESVAAHVLEQAKQAVREGIKLDVLEYVAA